MVKYIKYCLFMIILGLIVSLTLSTIYEITYPIIEDKKINKVLNLLSKVDSDNKWIVGEDIINIKDDNFIDSVYISINDNNEYKYIAYYIVTKGYANGNIESLVFIDYLKKEIKAVEIINIENQTKGIGSLIVDDKNYVKVFENVTVNKYINDFINNHNSESVDIISGATISSKGVVLAVITACNNFNKIKE